MTAEQKVKASALLKDLEALSDVLDKKNLFATTRDDRHGSVILSANEEGLIYLATLMLSMAVEAKEGQHYHFDKTSLLWECQRPLIIQFNLPPQQ